MQNNSTQDFSDEGHCLFHLHIKNCGDDVFYNVIYYVSIILAAMLAITAGGLWLKRRFYIKSSQKVAFLDGYLLWQTLHASIRIINNIIILSNLIEREYMILELLYDIPFYCDQVSVILFIIGILLAIPHSNHFPATPSSQRSFQIFIPSHNRYFHSILKVRPPNEEPHLVHLETQMIRAHYIVYAISWISIAICFAYFGRKMKRFAESSIGLLMDIEMDSTKYGRLRLMRRSITRMNIVNGFLCAKYLLFAIGATIAAFQLESLFSIDWISKLAAMSHSQHTFSTWDCTMDSPNQHDKNEFSLLPPPPSYKDDNASQQYDLVQEIEHKQHNANRHSNSTTISINHPSHTQNSVTILPDIIISSPPEITVVEKSANRVIGKSKFVAAWILDQCERTSTKELPKESSS
ncbi:13060_t:CDS:2 [Rhizophagus irregularis]|nr:13060_t:CDS:2 [Rhizophagus irregularis]